MPTYTNVQGVTLDTVSVPGAKSISTEETINRLDSQADGARGPTMVGELYTGITASIECEDNGTRPAISGLTNAGSLVYDVQLDSAAGTTLTHTITNMVNLGTSYSTNQDNPNGVTYACESKGTDSVWSIA